MRAGKRVLRVLGVIVAVSILATACGTTTSRAPSEQKRGGGYYKDDGPGSIPARELSKVPDATPSAEPLRERNNQPYLALGKAYTPNTRVEPFRQSGVASWYGRRFHGRPTASGERYDMYAMTAAHPTLPFPSYVRVTSLENGRSVVVRINDRGPFVRGRIIDLSYAAASKLGYIDKGKVRVEVEQIQPGDMEPAQKVEPMPDEGLFGAETEATSPAPGEEYAPNPTPAIRDGASETSVDGAEGAPESYREIPSREEEAVQNSNAGAVSDVFLQLGVFTSRENAESFRSYVSAQLVDLKVKTELVIRDGYFRIYAGPYASPTEARTAAERIGERMGIQPFIVRRD